MGKGKNQKSKQTEPQPTRGRKYARIFIIILLIVIFAVGGLWLVRQSLKKPVEKIDYTQLKKEATSLYKKGKYKEAIPRLEKYVEGNKYDFETSNLLASSYWQTGNFKKAFEQHKAMLKIKPGDGDILYRLGLLAEQLGQSKQAVKYFEQAVNARPEMGQFHSMLARAYARNKQYDKALLEWQTVLTLIPADHKDRAIVYGAIGDVYLAQGMTDKAKEAFEKGLAIQPDNEYLKSQLAKTSKK